MSRVQVTLSCLFVSVTLLGPLGPTPSSQASKTKQAYNWTMFHGNAGHRGYAPVNGPKKANLKWRYQLTSGTGSPPGSVAIGKDGTVYIAGGDTIAALSPSGTAIWSKGYPSAAGPALDRDGNIYFLSNAGDTGSIVSLDKNGNERWKYQTGGRVLFGPTIARDGTIYQGSWDHFFYALTSSGALKWKYQTAGAVSYPASVDVSGKTVFLGGGDAHAGPDPNLYAFATKTGKLKWKKNTGVTRVGSPAIAGEIAYVPASPKLMAVKSSGKVAWQLTGGACPPPPAKCGGGPKVEAGIISPAVGRDGTVYFGNSSGILYAINPKNHKVKWSFKQPAASVAEVLEPPPDDGGGGETPEKGFPSFPVVDLKGTVYIGAGNGVMYAVSRKGKLLWSYTTGSAIAEASPALGKDGTLYFSSNDGYLYAIGR